jgi:glycosyltransferase involved in cell wall biosynthesis
MLCIIIPALNEEKFLPQLLASIEAQNLDCEIIIADADSTDHTRELALQSGCRVVRGGRQAKGRNEGAKVARGDLLLFLDADIILPNILLNPLLTEFKRRHLAIATCSATPLSRNPFDWLTFFVANTAIVLCQSFHPFAQGFFILIKKSIHEKIGGFDETITFGEDSEYVARAAKHGHFGVLPGKIMVSARRFAKEGRVRLLLKYLALNLRRIFRGEIREKIDYPYGRFSE